MSTGRYVLALDQGTTSSRALLFDQAGQVSFTAQQEFRQIFPQPGWVEHDPEEIWASQLECARKVLAQARIDGAGVAAVGITNQRETTLVWERATGRPIYNAIVWQDRRTAPLCDSLRAQGADSIIQQKTGLVLDAYFSATKLRWILDNVAGARARAESGELAFGTVDSWLIWRLSEGNQHCTDVSNAARTMLYNIHRLEWDQELLELFAIPAALLPRVYANDQALGFTRRELFASAIPLAGIAGDQQAALFGQMCVRSGMAKNTYGTGCFMLLNTGAQAIASRNRLLTTVAWQRAARTDYAMEGSVFVAGAAVQWLRDGLGIIKHAADVEPLARSVADAGGVVLVPAFTGMGAPHWDAYARGALFGLTRGSGAGHIARAALESIALQSAEVLDAMQADASVGLTELRVDGGASRNDLLMQIQADVLGVPVVRPVVTETTALGAAYLAGLNVGFWADLAEVQQQWRPQRVFEPSLAMDARTELRRRWAKAVQRAKGWEAADK